MGAILSPTGAAYAVGVSDHVDPRRTGETTQSFGPTSGVGTGWVGLGALVLVAVATGVQERSLLGVRVVLGVALAATLVWCYLLRPRLRIGPRAVVLRNAYADLVLPLHRVDGVRMSTVTKIYTDDDRTWVGVAVGHPVRAMMRESAGRRPRGDSHRGSDLSLSGRVLADRVPQFVEQRITDAVARAKSSHPDPGEAARRVLHVPLLALTGLLAAAFVVSLLV